MKAMIFSAGLGTRFRPWTEKHPKALAPVNGVSLLERNVRYLQQYNIHDVIVNIHHFPEQIRDAINEHNGWGSRITISDESGEVLETGGGLLKAQPLFTEGEDFITLNVDILTDLNLRAMYSFHQQQQSLITLAVSDRNSSRCFVFDSEDQLCGWRNLQSGEEKTSRPADSQFNKAFSGISIFNYAYFDKIELKGKYSLVDAFLLLASQNIIKGYDHTGDRWVDVGRPESVDVAAQLFPG